jgi:CHRD domain
MRRVVAVSAFGLVALAVVGLAIAGLNRNYNTQLSGAFEVPVRDTSAHGQAMFQLNEDGTELSYKLNVANIENVIMAHIHCGDPTVSGPIVIWLYPSTVPDVQAPPGGGPIQGRIAEGTVDDDDVVDRPDSTLCPGGVSDLADVVAKLNSGDAYVNVHTNDGVAPTNTGPGDFPGGEIRGNF